MEDVIKMPGEKPVIYGEGDPNLNLCLFPEKEEKKVKDLSGSFMLYEARLYIIKRLPPGFMGPIN